MSVLREAFIDELRDVLDAERQLLKALPKLTKAAENEELQGAFEEHAQQTEEQIRRLEQVFKALDETARGKKCMGMEGLIKEGQEKIEDEAGDAALIGAAQKAEHYEIAAYGTLIAWATAMEENEIVELLQETLDEEKETDEKLTTLAETIVNEQESEQDEEEEEEMAGAGSGRKKK
jgi:ferritin-like metal-binding protein YciE